MWLSLELLMENSSARIVKQTNQNLCFELVVKVSKSWLFIVLILMPKNLLACFGGGGGYGGDGEPEPEPEPESLDNKTHEFEPGNMDDTYSANLTGIKGVVDRNTEVAWNGWNPSEETKKEWREWYEAWQAENEKNGEGKKRWKKGKGGKGEDEDEDGAGGGPGVADDNRRPGSGWPKLPEWSALGKGSPGVPVPPWAYVPKNMGRPNLCYLPPLKGQCRPFEEKGSPGERFGFNPYTNQCESYDWSGCGGTRNKFLTKEKCEEHCTTEPPQSCSADSGIQVKPGLILIDKLD